MEKARVVFAMADGLTDVQVANVPGLRELLQVRAPADHDWAKTAAEVAQHEWRFEAFRADDVAANLRRELAKELAAAPPDGSRQRAWATFGRSDPRLHAERVVLGALEQLAAGRARMWDPRLEEVEAAAVALRQFWAAMAPALEPAALPAVAPGAGPGASPFEARIPAQPWTERVHQALAANENVAAAQELAAAQRIATPAPARWLAMQFAWRRIEQQCAAVQQHAQRLAERTLDVAAKQAYAELARQCADIAGAVRLLTNEC